MKPQIERGLRHSVIAGTAALAVFGFASSPALADMVVEETTSYANPPAVMVATPAPPAIVETAPHAVTYTYQAPPVNYVERTETITSVPRPPVTREVTVDVVQDTPKYDYTVHKRVQTAQAQTQTRTTQAQTHTVQHRSAPRCQCQPAQ
ncbi:MAG: hypothetical protein ACREFI_20535 [Stellaceae bacterium]